ncbi:hypothetical protein ACE1CD_01875 [Aerosakkonema sp. BLCC-F183]
MFTIAKQDAQLEAKISHFCWQLTDMPDAIAAFRQASSASH